MFESQVGGPGTTLGALGVGALTVVAESDSLETVASVFRDCGTSSAVLEEPPVRIVTDRDLALAWASGKSAEDEVALIASAHPCWTPVTTSVGEAAALMIHQGIRHLVLVDITGCPTGIVSMSELLTFLIRNPEPMALYTRFAGIFAQSGRV